MIEPHPFIDSLTASGINLLSLQSYDEQAQRNRARREALKHRIQAAGGAQVLPVPVAEDEPEEDDGPNADQHVP